MSKTEEHQERIAKLQSKHAHALAIEQDRPAQGHTPGPWTVTQDSPGTLDVNKQDSELRSRIARLHVEHLAEEHGGSITANARLIASAPDLLAVAKDALSQLRMYGIDRTESGLPHPTTQALRCAIAKAEGRAQ